MSFLRSSMLSTPLSCKNVSRAHLPRTFRSTPTASSSRIRPLPTAQRCLTFTTTTSARQVLGRITPKRIAIPINRAAESDPSLPRAFIWKPILFTLAFGGGGYALLAAYANSDLITWSRFLGIEPTPNHRPPTDRDLQRAKTLQSAKNTQETVTRLPQVLSFLPTGVVTPITRLYVMAGNWWYNTLPGKVAPVEVIAVMGVVFLGWRIARFERGMNRWFLHRSVNLGVRNKVTEWRDCLTLFTSTISHQSLPHFAFNSIALFSFGSATYAILSSPLLTTPRLPSTTHTPHFLAFLLTAGLFSSLASHLHTNIFRLPKLLKALRSPARLSSAQALAANHGILPGLGASGAIYAALTLTACGFPDSAVALIFLPFFSIPIGWGVGGMVAVDLLGLIRGWRVFDHVAHLGGALFGVIYFEYGREAWAWTRKKLWGPISTIRGVKMA